jgi:hypothetical protein
MRFNTACGSKVIAVAIASLRKVHGTFQLEFRFGNLRNGTQVGTGAVEPSFPQYLFPRRIITAFDQIDWTSTVAICLRI